MPDTFLWVGRTEWRSLNTKMQPWPGEMPEVYIHHVAGPTPVDVPAEMAHMRSLQVYAITPPPRGKGYVDLDYNVIIGPSGAVYEGRGYHMRSAATLDRNSVSRAVCLMGNLHVNEPTAQQLAVLPHVIVDMIRAGSLSEAVDIRGHYQNPAHPGATSCPGAHMVPHLPGLRGRVDQLLAAPWPPPPQPDIEDDIVKYTFITAPARPSALLAVDGAGVTFVPISSQADAEAVIRAYGTPPLDVTVQQYDEFLRVSQS